MTGRAKPWVVMLNGRFHARARTRRAAMNTVDRPYRSGFATVRNTNTGEFRKRVYGSWVETFGAKDKAGAR